MPKSYPSLLPPDRASLLASLANNGRWDVIVIGGRLPSFLADRLAARLSFYSVPVRGRDREFPELLVSKVTGDAAALGASALCFNKVLL